MSAMPYKVVIVDDEAPARKRVADLLRGELDVQVAAQCADGVEARAALERHRPDILFLDVQMPEVSGFEVVGALPAGANPAVVFTTAHEQHAARAFDVDAVDYLLKPFTRDRFRQALGKAREFLQRQTGAVEAPAGARRSPGRIMVKNGDRILLLRPAEIDWVRADGNYLELHTGKSVHLLRATLGSLEAQLTEPRFARVSRSALVNVERVRELIVVPGGQHSVVLADGQRVPVTRPLAEVQAELGR